MTIDFSVGRGEQYKVLLHDSGIVFTLCWRVLDGRLGRLRCW